MDRWDLLSVAGVLASIFAPIICAFVFVGKATESRAGQGARAVSLSTG
jgi:hypothetical protein